MAPAKRKAEEKQNTTIKEKKFTNDATRPAKRQRQEVNEEKKETLAKDVATQPKTERKPVKVSLLQEEERAFPRGGGGVLTPLEHKQIQVQATRDALFEETGQKRAKPDDLDSDFGSDSAEDEDLQPAKKGKKTRVKTKKSETGEKGESRIRVEGLKFKVSNDNNNNNNTPRDNC